MEIKEFSSKNSHEGILTKEFSRRNSHEGILTKEFSSRYSQAKIHQGEGFSYLPKPRAFMIIG
ncbi:MAG: hypothetical protein EBS53_09865 [Bacteroidetes bacterium]|nr:hypothetical protein [Bacteroidota bacterium]